MAALTLLRAGLCTLVVDAGRPHSRSLGVPLGGAADRWAWEIGNALVGNPPGTAALEMTAPGPVLTADDPLACVVFGAPFSLSQSGSPWPVGKTFTLPPGAVLTVGGTPRGLRAYLCVRGGLLTPAVLGSRSSLEPLPAGTVLPCLSGVIGSHRLAGPPDDPEEPSGPLRVLPGAQADEMDVEQFHAASYTVRPDSNRMGLRLAGPPLAVPAREMVSEPVCPGSVQVTRDGQCIVLGVDGQTIGGYPKIAQVISADLDRLAQLRPGDPVTFAPVAQAQAEALLRDRLARLQALAARLRTAQRLA